MRSFGAFFLSQAMQIGSPLVKSWVSAPQLVHFAIAGTGRTLTLALYGKLWSRGSGELPARSASE